MAKRKKSHHTPKTNTRRRYAGCGIARIETAGLRYPLEGKKWE